QADTLLLMPDLFRYFLSGEKNSECSIASTTQLFDMREKQWSWEVIGRLNLPERLFTPLVPWGAVTGKVSSSICEELGILPANVIAVAGHDTQSAMAAIPTQEKDYIFLSCGTWSILGTELDSPVISEKSLKYNITNELGVEGKYSFLKNIIGLWLVQESQRQWLREGKNYDFAGLEEMASKAEILKSFITPDVPEFLPPGDVPERIRSFCRKTGQPVPETEGEIICCINQSLAMAYRKALDEIAECTGKTYSMIYLVGGGAQSSLLCQMTADACNCTVVAGPIEATAFGNVMVQYIADHEFADLQQARKVLAESVEPVLYEPKHTDRWEEAYQWYCGNF
ncbi:MAG: rhamnulokinase, partial [Lacrimispora sphenoides]